MSIHTFFKSLTSTSTRRRPTRRSQPASRLCLETLEDRCLLSFSPAVSYPVGVNPQAVVTGDFNGDGRLDLAVANQGGNSVSILLGNANGTFQPAQNSATGAPQSLAVGDFNGDGKLDLVTTNSVLLGNGNGTFQAPQSLVLPGQFPPGYTGSTAVGQAPSSVAVGDLNGDGKLDLAVRGQTAFSVLAGTGYYGNYYITRYDGYINVLLGNGDGSFTPKAADHLDNGNGSAVALGDFNGDGKLDVLEVFTSGGDVSVLPGNGDGTFQAPVRSASGVAATSLVTGDLNGDGKLDLVTNNFNMITVQKGNGDGTFQVVQTLGVASNVQSMVVGDVNGDGKLDIAALTSVTHYASYGYYQNYDPTTTSYAEVLLGHGDGSFAPTSSTLSSRAGCDSLTAAALGDFNGDGRLDLAATDVDTNTVLVAQNAADWSAPPAQASSFTVSGFPSSTTAGGAGSFTVTANNTDGTTATGYTGTVHFSSSDAQAGLPADYTFTAVDAGVHAFSATLKTAGTQALTATDTTTASLTGSEMGITVNPAAASTFTVTGFPSPTSAGVAHNFTITALDPYGNIAAGYTGMVHFSSSAAQAVLPSNSTLTNGTGQFSAMLNTAGTQSITVKDTATVALSGSEVGITVNPAAASKFIISAPASVRSGVAFSLTITVQDAYGNVVTGYTGTIHFTSTDGRARLPANYTFTAADKGVHTFSGLVLRTKGTQKITLTDTLNSSLTGSVTENVLSRIIHLKTHEKHCKNA